MKGRASLVAAADAAGCTRLLGIRSAAPLALRSTPDAVYLVGTAAGPLGGDRVALDIEVGERADVKVRTAAASVALAGASDEPSRFDVRASVGTGGLLRWLPEPCVSAAGSRRHTVCRVHCAGGARLVWREEVVLGRHREPPGSYSGRLQVYVAGRPVLCQQLDAGPDAPGWDGAAVLGAARAVGSVVVVDPVWASGPPPANLLGPSAAVLPLAGPAVQITALAADAISLRRLLDAGLASLSMSTDGKRRHPRDHPH